MDDANLDVKLVVLGCTDVGKTSLTMRFCHNSFETPISATIGASFQQKRLQIEDTTINLQIWDTAGQERFRSMAPMYYRNAKAAILVFDITKKETFTKLREWLSDLRTHVDNDIVLAVVGNKFDSPNAIVEPDVITSFGQEIGANVHLTSAKTGKGVDEVFYSVSKLLLSKQQKKLDRNSENISLSLPNNVKKDKKCC